jgi:murein L,D-transpeptidase YafK
MKAHPRAATVIAAMVLFATSACSRGTGPLPDRTRADRIVIDKSERRLTLFANGTQLKSYRVALGRSPDGPKLQEGDNRTPEGSYSVAGHNDKSSYHVALRISYPNAHDRQVAKAAGVSAGGDIMIHGIRNGFGWVGPFHRFVDWTRGCIAVTDDEIEEIARVVPDGAAVEIRP